MGIFSILRLFHHDRALRIWRMRVTYTYVMQEDAAEGVVWFTSACMMRMLC